MSETVTEFDFVSSLPQKKTRKGLIAQVRAFWQETDGGAIPVSYTHLTLPTIYSV